MQQFLHLRGADPQYGLLVAECAVPCQVGGEAYRGPQRRPLLRGGGEQGDLVVAHLEVDGDGCAQMTFEGEQGVLQQSRSAREAVQRFTGVRWWGAAPHPAEEGALGGETARLGMAADRCAVARTVGRADAQRLYVQGDTEIGGEPLRLAGSPRSR